MMNPTSPSPRAMSPADRPPQRDPHAAGAPPSADAPHQTATEFAALVDQAAAAPPSAITSDAKVEGAAKPGEDASEGKDGLQGETTPQDAPPVLALPVTAPLLSPAPPLPPPANGTAQNQDSSAPAPVAAASASLAAKPHDALPSDHKTMSAKGSKEEAKSNAALIPEAKFSVEAMPAPPPQTAPPQSGKAADAAPLPAPPPPLQPTPLVALPAAIALRAMEGGNRFEIRLHPADLGRVDVALEIDDNGSIRAAIAAEKPEALQIIVREARALEQALDQAGFRREADALSFSLSGGQDFSQGQSAQRDDTQRPQGSTRFFVEGEPEPLPPTLVQTLKLADGRLDVRI